MRAHEPVTPDADQTSDVLLSDGTTAHVRPIRDDDDGNLRDFHARLSPESIILRFFGPHPKLSDAEVQRFTHCDGVDRVALVAELAGRIIAVARYDRPPVATRPRWPSSSKTHSRAGGWAPCCSSTWRPSLGATGSVGPRPTRCQTTIACWGSSGMPASRASTPGRRRSWGSSWTSRRPPRPPRPSPNGTGWRRCAPWAACCGPAPWPSWGASRRAGNVGHQLVANLISGGFTGPVYPVNPSADTVAGVPAWPSVGEVPGPVDMAVVAVAPRAVPAVVEACGAKGVGVLVVVTAGFAETGGAGVEAQDQLVRLAHAHGMRMVGPNCFGVINTEPDVSLNATLAPSAPVAGPVGFASQSGGLGVAVLAEATARGLGLSSFVSLGNKADVSGNDALAWWEHDDTTDVVLLYLESFGNPRKFSRIARHVSGNKPIVAVKSGRSAPGTRGAASHTAALASSEEVVDALFRQTGVIRVDSTEELFDVAEVLARQPLPRGGRVGLVANAGGPGVLAADACAGHGLSVPELSAATQAALRSFLPMEAAVSNPVDMVASASADDYRRAVDTLVHSAEVDIVLAIFTPRSSPGPTTSPRRSWPPSTPPTPPDAR